MLGKMTMEAFLALASKEATYSTAFIAMPLACIVVITFEYFQTLKSEAKFIWTTPWNNVKCLFYLNRLAPVFLLATALCYALIESPTIKTCKTINAFMCSFIGLCHLVSEVILYLRVWAISGHSRKLGAFLICNAIVVLGACIALMSMYLYRGEWGAKETIVAGCITHSRGSNELPVTIIFALFLYSGLTVMVLCVYFGIRFYRESKPGPLLVVFYRDGTVYFVVVFAMSVTSAIITTFLPKFSRFVITIPYSMIMTVICTRMVLHLRQIAQRTEQGSLADGHVPHSSTFHAATLTWEVR